jgi:hypothetical protein
MEDHPAVVTTQEEDAEFKKFMDFHAIQLYAVQFPRELEKKLFEKLKNDTFDIGFKVKMMVDEEEQRIDLQCCVPKLKKNEDVFLVDHAWTFKQRDADKVIR